MESPYAKAVKKTRKPREEITLRESRPQPEAPVIGHNAYGATTNERLLTRDAGAMERWRMKVVPREQLEMIALRPSQMLEDEGRFLL